MNQQEKPITEEQKIIEQLRWEIGSLMWSKIKFTYTDNSHENVRGVDLTDAVNAVIQYIIKKYH